MADFAPNPGSRTGKGYGSKRIGTLQNLGDVEFSDAAISNGYALVWNSTTQRWTTGAVASALSSLSDVTVSEGAGIDTFLLYWNNGASKWEAKAFSFGNISGSVAAGQMPALTGDITTPAGAVATTLATVNGSPSSYGAADHTLEATVNAKGLITSLSSVAIAIAAGAVSGLAIQLSVAGINAQTASYVLVLGDAGKLVQMNVGSANNLTVPLNATVAFPIGTVIDVEMIGAGVTTIVATGGVTINSANGLVFKTQFQQGRLTKSASDVWEFTLEVPLLAASATTDTTNASNISSGTLPAARLPNPGSSSLGGVESIAFSSYNWISYIDTSGVPHLAQPAFTDISGIATSAQLPNPVVAASDLSAYATLGGV